VTFQQGITRDHEAIFHCDSVVRWRLQLWMICVVLLALNEHLTCNQDASWTVKEPHDRRTSAGHCLFGRAKRELRTEQASHFQRPIPMSQGKQINNRGVISIQQPAMWPTAPV
jgi:hypothetical protein